MSHTRKRATRLHYARVSTQAQDLTRQRQALKAFGFKTIFEDRAYGKCFTGRPELSPPSKDSAPVIALCWPLGQDNSVHVGRPAHREARD